MQMLRNVYTLFWGEFISALHLLLNLYALTCMHIGVGKQVKRVSKDVGGKHIVVDLRTRPTVFKSRL